MTTHRKTMSNSQLEVKPLFEKIRESLVNLDAYPKTLEDFRIKTFGGATGNFLCLFHFINLILTQYCFHSDNHKHCIDNNIIHARITSLFNALCSRRIAC